MKIIATAPSRLSLYGGGSDLPSYYDTYGGVVISLAINLRSQVTLYRGSDSWNNPGTHFPQGCNPDLYYAILKSQGLGGMHAATSHSRFDGVIGAGLGSSASFAVALITGAKKAKGEKIDRREIAELAWEAEQDLGRIGGKQDQYAASYGGGNLILFYPANEKIKVISYDRKTLDKLIGSLVLFYTGGRRESSTLQKKLMRQTPQQLASLDKMKQFAFSAHKAILQSDIVKLGELLHASWEEKKKLNPKITSSKIDDIYSFARKHGALGGKLCGAGNCGYMVFIVPEGKRAQFVEKMKEKNLEETDFSISYDGLEARIV